MPRKRNKSKTLVPLDLSGLAGSQTDKKFVVDSYDYVKLQTGKSDADIQFEDDLKYLMGSVPERIPTEKTTAPKPIPTKKVKPRRTFKVSKMEITEDIDEILLSSDDEGGLKGDVKKVKGKEDDTKKDVKETMNKVKKKKKKKSMRNENAEKVNDAERESSPVSPEESEISDETEIQKTPVTSPEPDAVTKDERRKEKRKRMRMKRKLKKREREIEKEIDRLSETSKEKPTSFVESREDKESKDNGKESTLESKDPTLSETQKVSEEANEEPKLVDNQEEPEENQDGSEKAKEEPTDFVENRQDSKKSKEYEEETKRETTDSNQKSKESRVQKKDTCHGQKIESTSKEEVEKFTESSIESSFLKNDVKDTTGADSPIPQDSRDRKSTPKPIGKEYESISKIRVKSSAAAIAITQLPKIQPIQTIIGVSHLQIMHMRVNDVKYKTILNAPLMSNMARNVLRFLSRQDIFHDNEKHNFLEICINVALYESNGFHNVTRDRPDLIDWLAGYEELTLSHTGTNVTVSPREAHKNELDYNVFSYLGHILIWASHLQFVDKKVTVMEKYSFPITNEDIMASIGGYHLWDQVRRDTRTINTKRWRHIQKYRQCFAFEEDQFVLVLRLMDLGLEVP